MFSFDVIYFYFYSFLILFHFLNSLILHYYNNNLNNNLIIIDRKVESCTASCTYTCTYSTCTWSCACTCTWGSVFSSDLLCTWSRCGCLFVCCVCVCLRLLLDTWIFMYLQMADTHLSFRAPHVCDIKIISESEFSNSFKTFLEMWLYSCWILGLRKNLKHFVIREEEEPRKVKTFLL